MVAGIGRALGQGLSRTLSKGVGTAATKGKTKAAVKAATKTKSLENVRQGSIIEAQKAKEKISKKQGFKKALKEAKAKKQKTFTYDGYRFTVANY
jgi:hypothetical protein